MGLSDRLVNLGFDLAMATFGRCAHASLLRSAASPRSAQERTLRSILTGVAPTAFARSLGLDGQESIDAFRSRVPIHDYESIRPFVDRQIAGEAAAIAPEQPLMYARTSGTTGAPKLVPVTPTVLEGLRRAQRAMAYVQHRAGVFSGKVLAIAGTSREVMLPGGVPAGATTGLIYETMPRLMRAKYVVPTEVGAIADTALKYETVVRLGLQSEDVSVIATANPSTILRLEQVIGEVGPDALADIAEGTFAGLARLPSNEAAAIRRVLRRAPDRARALGARLDASGRLTLADLWPGLRAVVTWTQGSCALAASAVASLLPPGARVIEAGYVASEARSTVIVDADRGLGLPLLDDVFFEFVPVEDWDRGVRHTLLLDRIEPGRDYHIIVTTAAGLLRYHMNDVVRATDLIGATPTLAFLRKGRGVTNITGEKLAEDQVNAAVRQLAIGLGVNIPFYLLIADDVGASYIAHLQIDGKVADQTVVAAELDQNLARLNLEYESKRKSGRLKPLAVNLLSPDAASAYHRHLVAQGQREAQLKVLTLQRRQDCDFDFHAYARTTAHAA
ncbi:MAG TPA: GH3 auxin-responsive promoter family protein [Bauldia sp.]|nr:GH3 auxin-responsive promoter family protein [Bauldia sp.]